MPSFFSRFSTSKSKDGANSRSKHPSSSRSTVPTPSTSLLPLELPSLSLLADTSRATPHFLSTPDRQPSYDSTTAASGFGPHGALYSPEQDGDGSDLRSLRSAESSRWVAVDADSTPRTIRTAVTPDKARRVGFPGIENPERARREQARLEKARLNVEDVTLLIEECGDVIRSRGLTTLGLFRPFRASESAAQFRKLALLFLDYIAEFDNQSSASQPDNSASPSRGTEASKSVLLHAYRQELRFANVHDCVAVLKWGLRHLDFGRMTFSSSRVPSLDWYTSFVSRSSSASPQHPYDAFSTMLLPSLPLSSQELLLAVLRTIQPVVAHAQQNAMPASRLCYLLGAYVFGLAAGPSGQARNTTSSGTGPSWDDFARQWSEAGRALEGCLKAYLREQSHLPPRLQELIDDYPAWIAKSDRSIDDAARERRRTIRALKVEIESLGEWETAGTVRCNSQSTGFGIEAEHKRPARRRPVEVLQAAIGADAPLGEQGPAEARAWEALVAQMRSASTSDDGSLKLSALDEETVRVLGLLGLDKPKTANASAASPGRPREGSPHRRTRSSVEPADFSPVRPQRTSFLSPSPSMPTISPRVRLRSSPSWQDFSAQGFAQSSLDLSTDLYDPAKNRVVASPPRLTEARSPTTRMVALSIVDVDEDLVSVWLDSLAESSTTMSPVAAWPCVLLAPLSPAITSKDVLMEASISTLLIVESLLPRAQSQANVESPPRPPFLQATSARPSEVNRRASFLGLRRGRKSEGATSAHSSPPSSPSKNWRRRASALFAPPLSSSHQQAVDDAPNLRGNGLLGRNLPVSKPLTEQVERPASTRTASGPPVDVFGTAIPLPATPPPPAPRGETLTAPPMDRVHTAELEGYIVDEPAIPSGGGVVTLPAVEDVGAHDRLAESAAPAAAEALPDHTDGDTDRTLPETAAIEPISEGGNDLVGPDEHSGAEAVPETFPHESERDLAESEKPREQAENAPEELHGEAETTTARTLPHEDHQISHISEPAQQPVDHIEPAPLVVDARADERPVAFDAPATSLPKEQREYVSRSQQATDVQLADPVHERDNGVQDGSQTDVEDGSQTDVEHTRVGPTTPKRVPPPIETGSETPFLGKVSSPNQDKPSTTSTVSEELISSPISVPLPPTASPPARSPRHPARGPSSPIRRSVTPTSHLDMHKRSASSMEEEIRQLRKVEEDGKRRNMPEPRTPKTVSNVKARVREIEEEAGGVMTSPDGKVAAPASPIRTPIRAQRPITPRRSSQRMRSTQSSTSLREMPSLAAAIVSGSPTSLAKPVDMASSSLSGQPEVSSTPFEAEGVPSESKPLVAYNERSELTESVAPVNGVSEPQAQRTAPEYDHVVSNTTPTPAQESEHLSVKVPTMLDELPAPLPTPTPSGVAVNDADSDVSKRSGPSALLPSAASTAHPGEVAPESEAMPALEPKVVSHEQESLADRAVRTERMQEVPPPATPTKSVQAAQYEGVAFSSADASAIPSAPSTPRSGHADDTNLDTAKDLASNEPVDHPEAAEGQEVIVQPASSDERGTPERSATAAGQPDHWLRVSPSKQSLATSTTSYQTADSNTPTPSEAGQIE